MKYPKTFSTRSCYTQWVSVTIFVFTTSSMTSLPSAHARALPDVDPDTARKLIAAAIKAIPVSNTTNDKNRNFRICQTPPGGTPSPTPAVFNGQGYTLSRCYKQADCVPPRKCLKILNGDVSSDEECDDGLEVCTCYAPGVNIECETCRNCCDYPNETCQRRRYLGNNYKKLCLSIQVLEDESSNFQEFGCSTPPSASPTRSESPSPSFSPSPTDVSSGVCIDARVFHADAKLHGQRLFKDDRMARVLCDPSGSCATPGHMVVFHATAMTMSRYCRIIETTLNGQASCTNRNMLVNSARYVPGLRIQSSTHHLQFSALAARFETRVEEFVLRNAIHIGL